MLSAVFYSTRREPFVESVHEIKKYLFSEFRIAAAVGTIVFRRDLTVKKYQN